MAGPEFIEQLRTELPRLLREHPEVRHELWGLMLEAFPSRQEFVGLLEEIRELREDSNRRFEAVDRRFEELREDMNRRFEAVDRRFEAVIEELHRHSEELHRHGEELHQHGEELHRHGEELHQHGEELHRHGEELHLLGRQVRELNLHMSSLGGRVGHGLEQIIQEVVEEFAGHTFPTAHRLILQDQDGEVFGVPKAEIEFDLYVHNDETAYLVEVKSHLKRSDVFLFHRKVQFAVVRLGRPVIPLIIALSMDPRAEPTLQELGVRYRIGAGGERVQEEGEA